MMTPVLGVITETVRAELESRAAASTPAWASYWAAGGAAASASVDPMQSYAGDPWRQPPAAQRQPPEPPPRPPEPPSAPHGS
eukprot:2258039-Alexandrium_andersonii.AAC.1